MWRPFFGNIGVIKSMSNTQGKLLILNQSNQIKIDKKERHRIVGLDNYAVVSEIWQHTDKNNPSNENDIVRLEDDYGRKK